MPARWILVHDVKPGNIFPFLKRNPCHGDPGMPVHGVGWRDSKMDLQGIVADVRKKMVKQERSPEAGWPAPWEWESKADPSKEEHCFRGGEIPALRPLLRRDLRPGSGSPRTISTDSPGKASLPQGGALLLKGVKEIRERELLFLLPQGQEKEKHLCQEKKGGWIDKDEKDLQESPDLDCSGKSPCFHWRLTAANAARRGRGRHLLPHCR